MIFWKKFGIRSFLTLHKTNRERAEGEAASIRKAAGLSFFCFSVIV